jgi:tRNA G18 (ribose-2'-O)-methylase SpoU
MFHVHEVESLDHPDLAPYRTMRRPQDHHRQGIFVAEGEKVVRRLLQSDFGVISLLIPAASVEKLGPLLEKRPENIAVYVADKPTLETLTGFSFYQGVLGVGKIPRSAELPDVISRSPRPLLLVALDSLANAENLGVVVRNCAALGVHGLIIGETCSSPYLRRSVRSSMGGIFEVPAVQATVLIETLNELRRQGIRCVAAHPRPESRPLWAADLRGDCCLVFGSEGYGISAPVLQACDETVAAPMTAIVDSLNVGSATGVFLYEVLRQRRS